MWLFDAKRQKESLGEYGSGWEWDYSDTLAFDQETIIIDSEDSRITHVSPIRYQADGTGTDMAKNHCINDIESTHGELLTSGSNMTNQISCTPNTNNSGNFYSWSMSTAGGQSSSKEPNSICPRGWQLITYSSTDTRSYHYLIRTTYNIQETNSDSKIRPLPISFIRSGDYDLGSLNGRGSVGYYWSAVGVSSTSAYRLRFDSGNLLPLYSTDKYNGFAVRCVSR